jgi:hypothetical protein
MSSPLTCVSDDSHLADASESPLSGSRLSNGSLRPLMLYPIRVTTGLVTHHSATHWTDSD